MAVPHPLDQTIERPAGSDPAHDPTTIEPRHHLVAGVPEGKLSGGGGRAVDPHRDVDAILRENRHDRRQPGNL